MKKTTPILATLTAILMITASCRKKEVGVCYCTYLSGDKKEFNLTDLTRNQAKDSCNTLSGYASAFAGSCKLK